MNSTEPVITSVPDASAPDAPALAASATDLAHTTSDYVQAWSALLVSETRLARSSVVRLAFAALVIPALALAICITLDAFIIALLNRWLHDWSSCIAIVLFANLLGLFGLLVGMRQWWRNLSLPRSRGALVQLLGRMA